MNIGIELIAFIIIIFIAALSRSTFGFGDALIAMPLLAMFFSIKTATPIVAFTGFFISLIILARNWKILKFKMIWQLILFSIIGIPLGVLFLKDAHEDLVKTVLAVMLVLFSTYQLFKPKLIQMKNDRFAFFFGLISGALGGAYNTNGPPIIIFGTLRAWSPKEFRVILQGIFLPTNLFIIIGHGIAGLWANTVFNYFLISLPVVLVAIIIGSKLNKVVPAEKFTKYIYLFLLFIGLSLLINIYF
ncbi:sulfite exporter TauE/SafE family protein [Bacteroidota bacterium]